MKFTRLTLICLCAAAVAAYAQGPTVTSGGVGNAAGVASTTSVAPGSLVSIYGSGLASDLTQASSVPLSTRLGNTSVTFNNIPAPLLFVSSGQINAQVPWEVNGATLQVVVSNNGQSSVPVAAPLSPADPGIFAYNGTQAIAYGNSDGLIAAAPNAIPGLNTHAAKIGDPTTLVILATGLGPVDPPVQTGGIPTDGALHRTTVTPRVIVGGVDSQVFFSGMSGYVGVYQLNIIIQPGTPTGDAVPVQIIMNGVKSNAPTIAVTN